MKESTGSLSHARRMRQTPTDAESRLWHNLRAGRLVGYRFRRQQPLGRFIVDFVCFEQRLIVEVDGSQHGDDEGLARDEMRTRWLQSEGYRVIRFWNNDVMSKTESVLEAIHNMIAVTPPRLPSAGDPPPQGEGKESRGEAK